MLRSLFWLKGREIHSCIISHLMTSISCVWCAKKVPGISLVTLEPAILGKSLGTKHSCKHAWAAMSRVQTIPSQPGPPKAWETILCMSWPGFCPDMHCGSWWGQSGRYLNGRIKWHSLLLPLTTRFPIPVQLTKIGHYSDDGVTLHGEGGRGGKEGGGRWGYHGGWLYSHRPGFSLLEPLL